MADEMLDRSIVAIIDIESFTKQRPSDQGRLVGEFVDRLNAGLRALGPISPDAWSTGDGAIISIGRAHVVDEATASRFLDFIVGFVKDLLESGVIVRTALNYSERDRIVEIAEGGPLRGGYIQVGDTINDAARIITFCEPREIIVSDSLIGLLRRFDTESEHHFVRNEAFRTKHEQILQTYSYDPPKEISNVFYSPHTALHRYKRFTNFPPIKAETLQYFVRTGLDYEIRRVVTQAYEAMETINDTRTFMSWSPVLQVLIQLAYDPNDEVLVVSRNDQPGFWNQRRRTEYLAYLRHNCGEQKYINQKRIMVYAGPDLSAEDLPLDNQLLTVDEAQLVAELKMLHRPDTFFSYPATYLFRNERVNELRFGFTLSRTHKFAIIPVPAPDDMEPMGRLTADRIVEILRRYPNYDPLDGPMKTIITADSRFVDQLIEEYDEILASPHLLKLK